ncbi:MAG: GFA family protein [Pseudomonadota bacterium]
MIRGRCECNEVRFEAAGEIVDFGHCHCAQCRRLHGAAYATFAAVERERFRYVAGEALVRSYTSSPRNERKFCSRCGSTILVDPQDEPEVLYLSMSTIEGDPPRPRGYHAWVDSKAPWHDIDDDLPQFARDAS